MVQTIGPWGFLTCAVDAFVVSIIYSQFFIKAPKNEVRVNSNNLMK